MATLPVDLGGVLLVDKPVGPTSHDVVARVRRAAGTRKVGHAGTLDPAASGLLVVGLGAATRLLTHLVGLDKVYTATIRLGASTTTDDAEGEVVERADPAVLAGVDDGAIRAGAGALTGSLAQVPSAVSAVKVAGRRAYELVRAGERPVLAPRDVTVSEFSVSPLRLSADAVEVDVRVACSSGTYVRALARDLGAALGVGGHLGALRRLGVGPFDVAEAHTLDELDPWAVAVSPAEAAGRLFPVWSVDAVTARDLGHGKKLPLEDAASMPEPGVAGLVAAVTGSGRLVGLVERRGDTVGSRLNFPFAQRSGQAP